MNKKLQTVRKSSKSNFQASEIEDIEEIFKFFQNVESFIKDKWDYLEHIFKMISTILSACFSFLNPH